MRKRPRFRPTSLDELERRVVLSLATPGSQVLVGNLDRIPTTRLGIPVRPVDRINQAFDSFSIDYLQAQRVYLDALATPGLTMMQATQAGTTFMEFTNRRGALLAQELTPVLAHIPGALGRLRASQRAEFNNTISTPLQAFLIRRITGSRDQMNNATPEALVTILNKRIPPAGTTGPAATLYTLTATNAIEAARLNTFNTIGILRTGRFTPKKG